ncbi:Uncharacterised protein [Mycobacterium tuberculosis]|uniref:Uncharacterized protein n=1 Tax=Mycobacterium tuberculosis TaxID=1773 RepID=A0A0U0RGH3_MYCTX|nr:Uncharacterised protein [Mycobacterium tuberculosis]
MVSMSINAASRTAGRTTDSRGIARSAERCSIG